MWDCLTCTLIREEEEELVLKDGSANRSAEDVLVECWCGLGLLKEVARVQERVAVELEDIPVKAVGALLDRGADSRAAVSGVLGVLRTGDEVELLKSIDVRLEGDGV